MKTLDNLAAARNGRTDPTPGDGELKFHAYCDDDERMSTTIEQYVKDYDGGAGDMLETLVVGDDFYVDAFFYRTEHWKVTSGPTADNPHASITCERLDHSPASDAQAMFLDDYMLLHGMVSFTKGAFMFAPYYGDPHPVFTLEADMTVAANRRRARVECVAQMQRATSAESPAPPPDSIATK